MTPNNILNMAMLKNLDFVAISDHNSAKQLYTIQEIEKAYDFIIIPAIEVTVLENFDVLCYFRTYESAFELDKFLESYLNADDWGPFNEKDQVITDIYDEEKSTFPQSLRSTSLSYAELYKKVKDLNGIIVLAHIERNSKSALLSYPLHEIEFDGIEIQYYEKEEFLNKNPEYRKYKILTSSDSHTLLTISERDEYLDLDNKSIESFFAYFKGNDKNE